MKVLCIKEFRHFVKLGTVYDVFLDPELEPYIIDEEGEKFYLDGESEVLEAL